MDKLIAKIKAFFFRHKVSVSIALAIILSMLMWVVIPFMPYMNQADKTLFQVNYDLKQGDYLFSLKPENLKNVTNIVVIGTSPLGNKTVAIKSKGSSDIVIYQNVSKDAFENYNSLVLTPYLQKNPSVDYRYMNDFVGLGKRLGVANDPNELISATRFSKVMTTIIAVLSQILIIGGILYILIYFQSNMIAGKTNKIAAKDIKDSFDDLIGMDDIKTEILQLEDMVINKTLYQEYNIHKNFNVMLTGHAGTGKTKIARCLAKRLDVPMFYSSASSLQSGYVGGGSKALKKLVAQASKHPRAIIFLDEAESLLQNRLNGAQHWENETINTLLALLDGVDTKKNEIIWLVASNMDEHKIKMDDAMLRRFQLKINFRLPNFEERRAIMQNLLNKMDKNSYAADLDLTHVAGLTSGMSPALLENLMGRASLIAINEKSPVTQNILIRAFERVAVGLTDRETTANMNETRKQIAIHESGHFILKLHESLIRHSGDMTKVMNSINVIKISTESVSKFGALGFVLSKQQESILQSRVDYEQEIMQLYGGMANEEIYFDHAGVTAGAQNDIEKVTKLLKMMIGEIGFYQNHKLNYGVINKDGHLSSEQYLLIQEKSEKLFNDTKSVLLKHRALTDRLSEKLLAEYVLSIEDAMAIVIEHFETSPSLLSPYFSVNTNTLLN